MTDTGKSNVDGSSWSHSYSYDRAGNIDEKEDTQTSEITDYSYNGDLMSGWQVGSNPLITLAWDDYNGRLTQSETATLEYNLDGKLIAADAGSSSMTLDYDPLGNRIAKSSTAGGSTTHT